MPQWRKLHTKIRESLDVNDMPDDFHRVLWTWLPLGLDREGRMLDNVALVKAKIIPLRQDVSLEQVSVALEWYIKKGMVIRYCIEGRSYLYVPTFGRYQGNRRKEASSIYPAPPGQDWGQEEGEDKGQDLVESRSGTESDQIRTETEEIRIRGRSRPKGSPPPIRGFKRPADLILSQSPHPDLTDQKDRAPPGFTSFTAAKQEQLIVRHLQNAQQRPLDDDQLNSVHKLMGKTRPNLALEMAQRTDSGKRKDNAVGYWITCIKQQTRGP